MHKRVRDRRFGIAVIGWLAFSALAGVCGCRAAVDAPARTDPVPAVGLPRHSGHTPPLRLSVEGDLVDGGVVLKVVLSVDGKLPTAPTLRVELSQGTTLVRGQAEEVVDEWTPGEAVVREFFVKDVTGPIRFFADAVSEAAGAHTEAVWPPPDVSKTPTAPVMVPIPPVRVLGTTIDRAVPLD